MKKESITTKKGRNPEKHFGAVNPPIIQTSTLIFPDLESYEAAERGEKGYESIFASNITDPAYGISGNQTHFALQELLTELEGAGAGGKTFLTPSGLSAITLVLSSILKAGDHVLIPDAVYGPTRRFCNRILKNNGVEVSFYNPEIGGEISQQIQPNTKLVLLESPGSFTFEMQEIGEVVSVCKEKNIITAIDNSWATPFYFQPLKNGIDISISALTKYINGHSDVLMGSITASGEVAEKIFWGYRSFGFSVSAYDCYLTLRGARSLAPRLQYQQNSLDKILQYLATEKKVKNILSPAYSGFKGYEIWKKYFSGATPLFSVELDKKYEIAELSEMFKSFEHFSIGASWGGYESLVRHVNLQGVRTATAEKYKNSTLIRFYLGLENSDDLIEDMQKAFLKLK